MSVIAFVSAKGSPGVTTALAALAATWPVDRQVLLVAVDPAGNDLATRLGRPSDPGLVSLAAQGRRQLAVDELAAHTQELDGAGSTRALLGPSSAEQTVAALGALRGRLAGVLAELDGVDVLIDCGRVAPGSPVLDLVQAAGRTVVVTRPAPVDLHHVANRLQSVLRRDMTSVLCVGESPYGPAEVADALGVVGCGSLPVDVRAADALVGGSTRQLSRSPLLRSARRLAEQLASVSSPRPAEPADRADARPSGMIAGRVS